MDDTLRMRSHHWSTRRDSICAGCRDAAYGENQAGGSSAGSYVKVVHPADAPRIDVHKEFPLFAHASFANLPLFSYIYALNSKAHAHCDVPSSWMARRATARTRLAF